MTTDSQPPHLHGSEWPFSSQYLSFLQHLTQPPASWSAFPTTKHQTRLPAVSSTTLPVESRKRTCTHHSDHSHRYHGRSLQGNHPYCCPASPADFSYLRQFKHAPDLFFQAEESNCSQSYPSVAAAPPTQHLLPSAQPVHILREARQSEPAQAPRQKILHVCHSTASKPLASLPVYGWAGPPDHVRVKLAKGPALSLPFRETASNEISTIFQKGQVRIREQSNHCQS